MGIRNCSTIQILITEWVCQGERIFVHLSSHLGQYHSISMLILGHLYLAMKVFAWFIDPHGIKNTNTIKYRGSHALHFAKGFITMSSTWYLKV
jgi:hypothetical protein